MKAEYILERVLPRDYLPDLPLGEVPQELIRSYGLAEATRRSRPWRQKVDLLIIEPKVLTLVEFKFWKIRKGLGELRQYEDDLRASQDLAYLFPREVRKRMVVPEIGPELEASARAAGIELEAYLKPWMAQVWARINRYYTGAYRREREDKIRARELLGLE